MLIGHVCCQCVKECDNPFILIDFEQMDFNGGHACDMIKLKLTTKRLHIRIKYFLQMHVHAASSERSCENAHLYRIDLAFAARMYVSSIDLNCLVHKYSFSFLHLLVRLNCDC